METPAASAILSCKRFFPVSNHRGELNRNLVAGQDLDKVHPHLPGYMGQNAVTVFQFHSKHGIGQGLNHPAFNLYRLFFRHNLHSGTDFKSVPMPPLLHPAQDLRSVLRNHHGMLKVSRKFPVLGDHGPSVGENLHPVTSLIHHRLYRQNHSLPELDPSPAHPVIGNLRVFMHVSADSMSDKIPDD